MAKKIKANKVYFTKNGEYVQLHSLPTKCPVCHEYQETQLTSFQYNYNDNATVQFRCKEESCNSAFFALYLKRNYGKEQYHCACFIKSIKIID